MMPTTGHAGARWIMLLIAAGCIGDAVTFTFSSSGAAVARIRPLPARMCSLLHMTTGPLGEGMGADGVPRQRSRTQDIDMAKGIETLQAERSRLHARVIMLEEALEGKAKALETASKQEKLSAYACEQARGRTQILAQEKEMLLERLSNETKAHAATEARQAGLNARVLQLEEAVQAKSKALEKASAREKLTAYACEQARRRITVLAEEKDALEASLTRDMEAQAQSQEGKESEIKSEQSELHVRVLQLRDALGEKEQVLASARAQEKLSAYACDQARRRAEALTGEKETLLQHLSSEKRAQEQAHAETQALRIDYSELHARVLQLQDAVQAKSKALETAREQEKLSAFACEQAHRRIMVLAEEKDALEASLTRDMEAQARAQEGKESEIKSEQSELHVRVLQLRDALGEKEQVLASARAQEKLSAYACDQARSRIKVLAEEKEVLVARLARDTEAQDATTTEQDSESALFVHAQAPALVADDEEPAGLLVS
jgi:hypothetical protein